VQTGSQIPKEKVDLKIIVWILMVSMTLLPHNGMQPLTKMTLLKISVANSKV
jgi:hypothetical protein